MRGLIAFSLLLAACAARPVQAPPVAEATAGALTTAADPARAADLRKQAAAAHAAREFARCADLDDEALRLAPETRNQAYDAACCMALAGRADPAFQRLTASADLGFRDAAHLASDPDLASLHADARWAAVAAAVQRNHEAYLATVNPELDAIYTADQGDRRLPPEEKARLDIAARDDARLARVKAILDAGGAKVSIDYFHAAMVFQHGHDPADYQRAHDLALKAAELDPSHTTARWLAAASEDRLLMNQGKPQKYGTQFRKEGGVWELYPVDPSVTDEERAAWGVPSLAEAQAKVARMNAGPP